MDEFQQRAMTATNHCNNAMAECEDLLQAILLLLNKEKQTVVKDANAKRYIRRRVANLLIGGGFGANMSRALEKMVVSARSQPMPNENAAAFDAQLVSGWVPKNGAEIKVLQIFDSAEAAMTEAIASRQDSLLGYMNRKDLGGAMCSLNIATEYAMKDLNVVLLATNYDNVAAGPWLVACKRSSCRFGAVAWPVCGIGCFAKVLGKASVDFLVVPIAEVLEQGISLPDFISYCESPTGLSFITQNAKIIHIEAGAGVAWFPYGFLVIPFFPESLDEKEKKGGGADDHDMDMDATHTDNCFVMHVPVFDKTLSTKAPNNAMTAIFSWNQAYYDQQDGHRAFAARADFFRNFVQSLG